MCILETALMLKILLNIFYLCHAPIVNEGLNCFYIELLKLVLEFGWSN